MATTYSNTKIETFNTCQQKYKFQYIEKVSVEKPVGVETFLGNAVHKALEKLYTFKMNGRIQPQEEVLDSYRKYWEGADRDKIKVTRDGLGIDDYIKVGVDALIKYYQLYTPFNDGISLALEKSIDFPLREDNRFRIKAKIDRINRRDDGTIEIIDYKTNAVLPTQQLIDDNNQMGLYQIGVRHLWPDFDRIELKQIFLRHGISQTAIMDKDKLEEIRYRTFQNILEMERVQREDNYSTNESAICNWCIYYKLCPAKRHRVAIESDLVVEFDKDRGRELAERYLKLSGEKKVMTSEIEALKEDIIRFMKEVDINRLDAPNGHVKLSSSGTTEAFPTKTNDEVAYLEISLLAREAGLDECFILDGNILYKEFYLGEKLPEELRKKFQQYIISSKQKFSIRPHHKNQ